jgi:hypothetical protein
MATQMTFSTPDVTPLAPTCGFSWQMAIRRLWDVPKIFPVH